MKKANWLAWTWVALIGFAGAQQAYAINATATGGYTLTNYTLNSTNFTAFIFTNSGNLIFTDPGTADVLVVAGGGGGGGATGGGGGAGGYIYSNGYQVGASNYTVTVGAGGSGGLNVIGSTGGKSGFDILNAFGGGGGGDNGDSKFSGLPGGSGGGGSGASGAAGGAYTNGQGYAGGSAGNPWNNNGVYSAGGGGGAGSGGTNSSSAGGNGGTGVLNSVSGVAKWYAGGGGGGVYGASSGGTGGSGVGGNGAGSSATPVQNGAANTGSGGGGQGQNRTTIAGSGGSGIVIVRYVTPPLLIGTVGATNILDTSAGLVGNLITGTAPVTVTCYWGTNDGGTTASAWMTNTSITTSTLGYLTNSVSGLAANRTNYFRYFASNGIATAWAPSTLSFKTMLPQGAPIIASLWATNLTPNTVSLVGNLTTGAAPVDVICYWGSSDGANVAANWANTNDFGTTPVGVVTTNLSGLTPDTTYYFRYYASNATSNDWAESTLSFTTPIGPSVNNGAGAASVSAAGATLQGNVTAGLPSPSVWIYWGTVDGLQVKGNWGQSIPLGTKSGAFSSAITNLNANQTYSYSCYASNSVTDGWAPASTNFTTPPPTLTIGNASVTEGAPSTTTNAVLAVTLNAPSAVSLTVNYATANGPYATAGIDYTSASGVLTIPAGVTSTQLTVSVLGGTVFSPTKTVYMNLSSPGSVTLGNTQGAVTIFNTNYTVYVRGDGFGSDTNGGGSWATAFASLTNALAMAPLVTTFTRDQMSQSTPFKIYVQASAPGTHYQAAARITGYTYNSALDLDFEGGWQNVASVPAQTGISVVQDVATNHAGISIQALQHYSWRRLVVNGFMFTNVTRGVEVMTDGSFQSADILLAVSNTTVYAQNDGLYISYLRWWPANGPGGLAQLTANNVSVRAGLGGVGSGVYISGSWQGSSITASGTNAATGAPWVSSITSANGAGVYFTGYNNEVRNGSFANTVIYNCASNGVHLDCAVQHGGNSSGVDVGAISNSVQSTFRNCTVADNAGDGVYLLSSVSSSWSAVTNSLFANNSGYALHLDSGGASSVFTCPEDYNVFYSNSLLVNGSGQSPVANDFTTDPLFYAKGAKPSPWYQLGSKSSPAYHSGSDGKDRGAYQTEMIPGGTAIFFH